MGAMGSMELDAPGLDAVPFDIEVRRCCVLACIAVERSESGHFISGVVCWFKVYISNYSSHTKVDRLQFIARKCVGSDAEVEALKLALAAVKEVRKSGLCILICAMDPNVQE